MIPRLAAFTSSVNGLIASWYVRSHIVVLATRPPFRGGRLRKAVSDVFTGAVKRAVLNPAYMNQAWARELEMLAEVSFLWQFLVRS